MKLQVKRSAVVIMLCMVGWFTLPLNSQTNPSRSTQQLILDKLANIEARLMVVENTQKMILREMDKRFEQVDKRFEQVDKRFEQVDNRFNDMMNYIIIMAVVFASMTGLTIGFALWDRRTMIRPFESKVKEIETNINENNEKLDKAQNLNNQLISVIRDYAKKDRKFAEIIKGYNIF
jgi:chaperonin cofactor prefoldin